MTTHYPYVLSLNKFRLNVFLGFYDDERAVKQPIEICLRLYFEQPPAYALDEKLKFLDYAVMCKSIEDYAAARSFRLIEFMTTEIFNHLRSFLNERELGEAKIWMSLNKVAAPVPGLTGGAAYTISDLPPTATVVAIHG